MPNVNPIPDKVVNYNVYNQSDKLVGVSAEIALPNLEAMTETITGAGIAGEFESPTPGHFGAMQIEIPFRTLIDQSFKLMTPDMKTLYLRASQQSYDISAGKINQRGLKISIKGMPKNINLGTMGVGKPTETTNVIEIMYIKIEESGKTLLEYDKFNFIYVINGVDVFANIRNQI